MELKEILFLLPPAPYQGYYGMELVDKFDIALECFNDTRESKNSERFTYIPYISCFTFYNEERLRFLTE